jgi:D-alanyl-D-alanine carboxypeptidase
MAERRNHAMLVVAIVVMSAGLFGCGPLAVSESTTSSTSTSTAKVGNPPRVGSAEHGGQRRGLGESHGELPEGVTVFDTRYPAVTKLDPQLLAALRRAGSQAAERRISLVVESGWRSVAYQQQLLNEAVTKYGSAREAARWVATPETSAHVTGDAVDIGSTNASNWLSKHGAEYGLCQIYKNEPWHFELRPQAIYSGCPSMYADPTRDPRLNP